MCRYFSTHKLVRIEYKYLNEKINISTVENEIIITKPHLPSCILIFFGKNYQHIVYLVYLNTKSKSMYIAYIKIPVRCPLDSRGHIKTAALYDQGQICTSYLTINK